MKSRGQLSLEALVAMAALFAFVLALVHAVHSLQQQTENRMTALEQVASEHLACWAHASFSQKFAFARMNASLPTTPSVTCLQEAAKRVWN